MNKEIVKNKYGFFELAEKPVSEEFLRQYYVYDTIDLYKSLSKLGLGREIISFFTKFNNK
jgi:hypothetical protein